VSIRGWFIYPSGDAKAKHPHGEVPTIVFLHENAGNIGLRIPYFKYLVENLGVNILTMAYRGYSYSDQAVPDEAGLKLDADAILAFLE